MRPSRPRAPTPTGANPATAIPGSARADDRTSTIRLASVFGSEIRSRAPHANEIRAGALQTAVAQCANPERPPAVAFIIEPHELVHRVGDQDRDDRLVTHNRIRRRVTAHGTQGWLPNTPPITNLQPPRRREGGRFRLLLRVGDRTKGKPRAGGWSGDFAEVSLSRGTETVDVRRGPVTG